MNKYYDNPPAGKLSQTEWERRNEDETIDRFLDDEIDEIKTYIKDYLTSTTSFLTGRIWGKFKSFKAIQYEEYCDTPDEPEYDRMAQEEHDEKIWGE